MKIGKVEKRIRELILMEYNQWPDNRHLKYGDKEYNDLLEELVEEVREFAIERMAKRWMKI